MRPLPEALVFPPEMGDRYPGDPGVAAELLPRAARAARHHTKGAGFSSDGRSVDPEIADVIVSSVRRALLNPELSLVGDEAAFTLRPGSFADWSFAEYAVLEQYRAGKTTP